MTTHSIYRSTPHPCDKCQHWGGWAPIKVGGVVQSGVHGLCLNPKHCKTVADPAQGCSLWTKMQKAPNP
jgi:hypothetical protein